MDRFEQVLRAHMRRESHLGLNPASYAANPLSILSKVRVTKEIVFGNRIYADIDESSYEQKYRYNWTNEPLKIKFNEEDPPRILIIGKSGAGKTTLICFIMEQLMNNCGMSPFICLDPKSEFPEKFELFLKTTTDKLKLYVPKFLEEHEAVTNREEITIPLFDLNAEDIMAMHYHDDQIPTSIYSILLKAIKISKKQYGSEYTISQFKKCIDSVDGSPTFKNKASFMVEHLADYKNVIGDKKTFAFLEDMIEGKIPILQFDDHFDGDDIRFFVESIIGYMIRKVSENLGKSRGVYPLLVVDESWIAAPTDKKPQSKRQIIGFCKYKRSKGGGALIASQLLTDISTGLVSNVNYIIIIGQFSKKEEEVLSSLGFDGNLVYAASRVCYVDSDRGERVAALFNTNNTSEVVYFNPIGSSIR